MISRPCLQCHLLGCYADHIVFCAFFAFCVSLLTHSDITFSLCSMLKYCSLFAATENERKERDIHCIAYDEKNPKKNRRETEFSLLSSIVEGKISNER